MGRIRIRLAGFCALLAAACQPVADGDTGAGQPPFAAIGPDETISLTGTEPFWGGSIAGERLAYTTPENPGGVTIAVRRFAGNSGLGFSGTRNGRPVDLTVTQGTCSDGMSDRTYPYTVTLRLDGETRSGCAWTTRQPFSGPATP